MRPMAGHLIKKCPRTGNKFQQWFGSAPDAGSCYCQVERIAKVRGLEIRQVRDLVSEHIENADLGVVGEDRVNVLKLNLALDNLQQNQ